MFNDRTHPCLNGSFPFGSAMKWSYISCQRSSLFWAIIALLRVNFGLMDLAPPGNLRGPVTTGAEGTHRCAIVQLSILLPLGLFERPVRKTVMWGRLNASVRRGMSSLSLLSQAVAILSIGTKRFRRRVYQVSNSVENGVEGTNLMAAHERVSNPLGIFSVGSWKRSTPRSHRVEYRIPTRG